MNSAKINLFLIMLLFSVSTLGLDIELTEDEKLQKKTYSVSPVDAKDQKKKIQDRDRLWLSFVKNSCDQTKRVSSECKKLFEGLLSLKKWQNHYNAHPDNIKYAGKIEILESWDEMPKHYLYTNNQWTRVGGTEEVNNKNDDEPKTDLFSLFKSDSDNIKENQSDTDSLQDKFKQSLGKSNLPDSSVLKSNDPALSNERIAAAHESGKMVIKSGSDEFSKMIEEIKPESQSDITKISDEIKRKQILAQINVSSAIKSGSPKACLDFSGSLNNISESFFPKNQSENERKENQSYSINKQLNCCIDEFKGCTVNGENKVRRAEAIKYLSSIGNPSPRSHLTDTKTHDEELAKFTTKANSEYGSQQSNSNAVNQSDSSNANSGATGIVVNGDCKPSMVKLEKELERVNSVELSSSVQNFERVMWMTKVSIDTIDRNCQNGELQDYKNQLEKAYSDAEVGCNQLSSRPCTPNPHR